MSDVTADRIAVGATDRFAPAIEVAGLRKTYAGRRVLRRVSFRVEAGEIFALVGPNGAGKTTTVEIIEGYRRADGGDVRVLGAEPLGAGRAHRARVGLMLQGGGGIDPRMTPAEVVTLHARFHADPLHVPDLLERVGLTGATARTRFRRLSGGEKQRVGLALALVGRPDIAILDEPTAGMDVEARARTRDLLADLRANGVTVVLTSHDLADVERLADRLAILDRGRIVALGTPQELTAAAQPVLRFRLSVPLSEPDRLDLAALLAKTIGDGVSIAVEADGGSGRYRLDGRVPEPPILTALALWCEMHGVLITELRTGGGTLEERYVELIGSAGAETLQDDDATAVDDGSGAGDPGRRRRRAR